MVVIVILNYVYFFVVKVFLEVGIYVICDKLMIFILEDVKVFVEIVVVSGK